MQKLFFYGVPFCNCLRNKDTVVISLKISVCYYASFFSNRVHNKHVKISYRCRVLYWCTVQTVLKSYWDSRGRGLDSVGMHPRDSRVCLDWTRLDSWWVRIQTAGLCLILEVLWKVFLCWFSEESDITFDGDRMGKRWVSTDSQLPRYVLWYLGD
jgi:hypothetical protein